MNNCAETQTKVCKAFAYDFYMQLSKSFKVCAPGERDALRKNVIDILESITAKVSGESMPPETENK